MEITIEKANGAPMSEKEAAALFRFLHDRLIPLAEKEDDRPFFESSNISHNVVIFFKEDASNVYASAFCPGISKDRLEVLIDERELIIRSKPADQDAENVDDSCGHSPWKCFEDISYEGKCELPNEIIAEKATAELSNGVLYITIPKPEAGKPKAVEVK